jgi:hypothetical protein
MVENTTSYLRDIALYYQSMLAGYKICELIFAKQSPNCYAFALYLARGICLMTFCHGFTYYRFKITISNLCKISTRFLIKYKKENHIYVQEKYMYFGPTLAGSSYLVGFEDTHVIAKSLCMHGLI